MKKRRAGFTLVEVLVALSITVVVMSLVASLVVIVNNVSNKQTYERQCQEEYESASELVEEYFNNYRVKDFLDNAIVVEENYVVVQDGENQYRIEYNKLQNKLSAEIKNLTTSETKTKTLNFEKIVEIKFSSNGNIILCEYGFENFPTYTNLITFGV